MKTNTFLPFVLKRRLRFIGAMLIVALMMPAVAFSQPSLRKINYANPAAVDLGTAINFRILAGSAITINGTCTVTGDVGLSPTGGAAITGAGTVTGIKYSTDGLGVNTVSDATRVGNAKSALDAAYNDIAGRTANATLSVSLNDQNLGCGIYSAGAFSLTTTLTLTGLATDIFIFQSAATLTTGASSSVTLVGVLPSNVFWQVTSSATIDGDFKGNILALTSITQTSGTVDGRLLARDAAVTVSGTSVLPVELTSFTAELINNAVELNWNTVTEVNNYGFDVERAIRNEELGIRNWKKVGFVQGNGNSNSPKEYSFTDKTISYGSYAYRLKQFDNDGAHTYSDVIEVNAAQIPNGFLLNQNYPNPFNPSTQIQFGVNKNTHATLTVFNVLGVKVSTLFNGNAVAGQVYNVTFNGDNLASGIYYYKLQTNEKNEVRKMILMR